MAGSYQGNALLAHIRSAFLCHFLADPGANADRKEERVERSAGAAAGAAAGGAEFHAGANVEDPQNVSHSASAGAGPLPERQTTIAWPVVGSEDDKAFRIPGCRSGTGRSALGLLAQPLGATATAPRMSVPPGRAAVEARDSKGAPGRTLTSARNGGPRPRGSGTGDRKGTSRESDVHGEVTEGGGGWTTRRRRAGAASRPGVLNIPPIIVAAAAASAAAATQGYAVAAAAASPSVAASTPLARVISPLKLLHLQFICGVAMDARIPRIWLEVCRAPTKAAALAVLSHYLWYGREVCRRDFFGSADMLHVCRALFIFVHRDRFVKPRNKPVCPNGGVSSWTTHQGGGNV